MQKDSGGRSCVFYMKNFFNEKYKEQVLEWHESLCKFHSCYEYKYGFSSYCKKHKTTAYYKRLKQKARSRLLYDRKKHHGNRKGKLDKDLIKTTMVLITVEDKLWTLKK